ncbi:LacI family DNA-binding transcriptional regulator [Roseivirga sp. E12]|uniref:LacI family DNA-binding transcriptional regulator n=1 Tax=Roseivirga sp. E12 TaxID=2819237 RepID=UPI001ABD2925|nr:LacI family DNA-binding transcriptional regulator [Roseivirga sp. E12]MBO3697507.1 LacI family DNA-binding transcriptional regulator [Roseivirga sp. E12]
MAVTIKDIATALRISPSTVSRALNDHPNISEETKKVVSAKAKELKYQTNFIAAGLRTKKSNSIGILVPHITSSFFASAIDGIQKVVSDNGYFTIICQSNEDYHNEIDQIRSLLSCKVEGVILSLSSETKEYEHLEMLEAYDTPFVFFDRIAPGFDMPTVEANDFTGGFQAVEHLIKRGRKRIAHLGGPGLLGISKSRYEGYMEALKTYDYEINEDYVVFTKPENDHGEIIEKMFADPKKGPDALFTFSDELAVEAILKLKSMGLNVPRDVSVVGFGNSNLCEIVEPHLTSVTHEPIEMGEAAADLLFKVIQNKHIPPHLKKRKFDSRVIIRDSSR